MVKRIIGLPCEQVTFGDGIVSIDGAALDEPYATPATYRGTFAVPSGHYLLLGDNRDASDDARSWQRPFVTRAELVGRLLQPGHP